MESVRPFRDETRRRAPRWRRKSDLVTDGTLAPEFGLLDPVANVQGHPPGLPMFHLSTTGMGPST